MSAAAERRQPGAFPIPGPDGSRRNSSRSSDACLETEDNEATVGPRPRRSVLRSDDASDAMFLVEANLVTDSGDDVPVMEGQAIVELSAAERKRKQRRQLLRFLCFGFVVATCITVGVTQGMTTLVFAVGVSLSPSLSSAPSGASTMHPLYRLFRKSLPNHTTILLQNPSSPQYRAWYWLTAQDDNLNGGIGKLRQRFALVCFHFTTNAFASEVVNQFSPLVVDECNWTGIVCNANGCVVQIVLPNSDLVGTVPRELYFLTELSTLNLARNVDLEETLSSDMQVLMNLEYLNVSDTNFYFGGSIPTELGQLL